MHIKKTLAYILATVFGIGYFPKIPGTTGSILAVLIALLILPDLILLISISVLLFVSGVVAATIVERFEGKDSGKIIIDEVVGQLLTFVFIPYSALNIFLGFVLFRIFDIWKPFPINKSQNLFGGWGVMIDDVLAALYANIILRLTLNMII